MEILRKILQDLLAGVLHKIWIFKPCLHTKWIIDINDYILFIIKTFRRYKRFAKTDNQSADQTEAGEEQEPSF